jgi:hypothetical protein
MECVGNAVIDADPFHAGNTIICMGDDLLLGCRWDTIAGA